MNDNETSSNELPIVMGITGASGAVYAVRTLQWLLEESRRVHLVVSPDGWTVIRQELGFDRQITVDTLGELIQVANRFMGISEAEIAESSVKVADVIRNNCVKIHQPNDYFSPIASGSYRTRAMIVCPCSGTTMAAIAHSSGRNLIHRAAEVHLKERRKLILVPRETPLSLPQIENMMRVTQAGGVVLPAAPGWYHGVSSLRDIVDFIAARILDQLGIDHSRTRRWQDD